MGTPDAIAVLAGGIKRDASGRWVSTGLTAEDDKLGAPGGKLRVLSAAVLANRYPAAIVVASGGRGSDIPPNAPEDRPLLAEILRDELTDGGISTSRVLLEKNSNSTYQQLQALEILIAERGWHNVMIVTNRYHLPRVRAMIEMNFPKLVASSKLISAEDVLLEADAMRWTAVVAGAYGDAFMTERIAKEEKGILQIKSGTYQF